MGGFRPRSRPRPTLSDPPQHKCSDSKAYVSVSVAGSILGGPEHIPQGQVPRVNKPWRREEWLGPPRRRAVACAAYTGRGAQHPRPRRPCGRGRHACVRRASATAVLPLRPPQTVVASCMCCRCMRPVRPAPDACGGSAGGRAAADSVTRPPRQVMWVESVHSTSSRACRTGITGALDR